MYNSCVKNKWKWLDLTCIFVRIKSTPVAAHVTIRDVLFSVKSHRDWHDHLITNYAGKHISICIHCKSLAFMVATRSCTDHESNIAHFNTKNKKHLICENSRKSQKNRSQAFLPPLHPPEEQPATRFERLYFVCGFQPLKVSGKFPLKSNTLNINHGLIWNLCIFGTEWVWFIREAEENYIRGSRGGGGTQSACHHSAGWRKHLGIAKSGERWKLGINKCKPFISIISTKTILV